MSNYDETNSIQAVCSGCRKESHEYYHPITFHYWARTDYNGFFTGLYCDKCYNNQEKYPYRKDNYNQDAIENGEDIWGDEQ